MSGTQLLDLLQLIPIQRAAVALIIASIGMPIIGVFVVGLNIVAVRFAMMHVALLGIALGLLLGIEPLAVALLLCALTGAAVTPVARRPSGLSDVMGLVMTLATRRGDLLLLTFISGSVRLLYLWQRRNLALLLYNRELALCSGVPVERLPLLLLVIVAVAIAAAAYCDRLHLMNHGQLVASGRPQEVLTQERIATVFGVDATVHLNAEGGLRLEFKPLRQTAV